MFILIMLCFFFFKQKTAYELRISDWSSDVCSSDLSRGVGKLQPAAGAGLRRGVVVESDLQRCAASQPQPQLAVRQDRMLEFELRDLLQRQFDAELLLRQTHRPAELQARTSTPDLKSLMRISYAVLCWKNKKQTKYEKTNQ